MAMIDFDEMGLDEAKEPYAVKGGEERKLVIVEVKEGTDKNGLEYLQPRLEIIGEPYAKDFTHFLHIPNKAKMTAKQLNRVRYSMDSFRKCFGIEGGVQDPKDSWPGHEGYAIVGNQKNEQYGEQNFISKLVIPQA